MKGLFGDEINTALYHVVVVWVAGDVGEGLFADVVGFVG